MRSPQRYSPTGSHVRGVGVREIAEAVLAAEWGEASRHLPMAFDLLLEGIALVTIDGDAAVRRRSSAR